MIVYALPDARNEIVASGHEWLLTAVITSDDHYSDSDNC